MKICRNPNCKSSDPKFSKNPTQYDGLHPYCKDCASEIYQKEKGKGMRRNQRHKEYSRWTLEEENKFRELFPIKTMKELMSLFGKSDSAIKTKASELGFRKLSFMSEFIKITAIEKIKEGPGVYVLINKPTGQFYIGSSNNIKERIKTHISNLNNNKHENKNLQENWNNCKDDFRVAIVSYDTIEKSQILENKIIQTYEKSDLSFNKLSHIPQPIISSSEAKRFHTKYTKDTTSGCWLWDGEIHKDGYGRFGIDNKDYSSHRISYFIHKGVWPGELFVLHKCDNKHCINPDHLELGSNYENIQQYWRTKREKLNSEITQIRNDWLSGVYTARELDKKWGRDVGAIISNRSYYDPNYHPPKRKGGRVSGKVYKNYPRKKLH